MRFNTYLSRKVVELRRGETNPNPFEFKRERRQIACKEVFIGNHNPGAHYAPVAQIYVEPKDLYQPRRR